MTEPAADQPTDAETLARMHDEMPVWTAIAVWTTRNGTSYRTHACGFHTEPRSGELRNIMEMQTNHIEEARAQDELVHLFTLAGLPAAIHPDYVGSIEIQLLDDEGRLIQDVQPGFIDRDGPVNRDEDGEALPGSRPDPK